MFEIKGKYNKAIVHLENELFLDEMTTSQIYTILNCPAFEGLIPEDNIHIMPDCHAGIGAVIGFTFKLNKYIVPNVVGVDIGCGVLTLELSEEVNNINFNVLDNFIRNNIPSGFSVNSITQLKKIKDVVEINKHLEYDILERIDFVSAKLKETDLKRNRLSLGTLGGGNHFIEIGVDSKDTLFLTVHSGSRKFGLDIATHHQSIAKTNMKNKYKGADAFKQLEWLNKKEMNEYLQDMRVAQRYAQFNRWIIALKILDYLHSEVSFNIESIHNYIDFDDLIIRKGAISSRENELLVIPLNMKDGIIIGKGKGNKDWNFSAPHGAGRILSRKKAKLGLNLEEALLDMKDAGIYTTSLNENSLDEAPGAYKSTNFILGAINDTIEVIDIIKPIYNFKAS